MLPPAHVCARRVPSPCLFYAGIVATVTVWVFNVCNPACLTHGHTQLLGGCPPTRHTPTLARASPLAPRHAVLRRPASRHGLLSRAQGKIKSLEQIYLFSMPVKECQIVDYFLGPALKDEVMKIMPVQKQTRAGQRTRFKVRVCVCVCGWGRWVRTRRAPLHTHTCVHAHPLVVSSPYAQQEDITCSHCPRKCAHSSISPTALHNGMAAFSSLGARSTTVLLQLLRKSLCWRVHTLTQSLCARVLTHGLGLAHTKLAHHPLP